MRGARSPLGLVVLVLPFVLVNAAFLMALKRWDLREAMERRARTYALLTRQPLCAAFETYHASGFHKFKEVAGDYVRLEPDLQGITIASLDGEVLFEAADLAREAPAVPGSRHLADPARRDALGRRETTVLRGADAQGRETLVVVTPYLEDWGRHELSVIYEFSYERVRTSLLRYLWVAGGVALLAGGAALAAGWALRPPGGALPHAA